MTRRSLLSILFVPMLLCGLLIGPTGCSLFAGPSAQDAFHAFADAIARKDGGAAAGDTDDPNAANPAITSMFAGMGKDATVKVDVSQPGDDEKTAKLTYSWTFGPNKTLTYDATATATQTGDDWHVHWASTVLHPKLQPGMTFQYSDDKNFLTPVTDRDGQPLLTWQTIGVVNLTRDHPESAAPLAALLHPFDDSITADSITGQFNGTQDATVTVIKLREGDLAGVRDQLAQLPGVSVVEQGALLTANRDISSPAIGGLQTLWQKAIDDAAGWSVTLVATEGKDQGQPTEQLASTPPGDTPPIRTTLDNRLQLLAQQAVAAEARPAVLVAISPATGGILAAAQNAAANAQGPIAFSGAYPPGSTFKTITTAAALKAGLATPDTPEPCPGTVTIENRTIPNEDEFDLGTVPLSTAFSHSCNTTMAALSDRLPPDALPNMARLFGIGVDYVIPGLVTITGRVPNADTPAQKVENGIGQGTVTVSPFGLAVAEASLGHGSTITPTLVVGQTTMADTPSSPIPPTITDDLRAMMLQTVSDGTATELRDVPGLGGKTGTAEFGDNTHSHGWFAGITGDIAFATLVVGGDSSAPAVKVSGDFLRRAVAG
ncbi:penicillin-binding transpeptidase domain-containing protein [Mycolicibacterium sp. 050158]|uniref:penicillin-binding transpeptidase domain-containing protein n=1 Tax=Mycolicibacterium sp. 050158 TaxID=3090602 RepID=UPI00299E0B19|nr:penicillin-binding transpeptidase domain-containing protein [Mycolicibacterium sp. 050158]MDX1890446.1 penicillin-binding transpeptidase domain-containing protein [Mycolicibacterium sp. 050158]